MVNDWPESELGRILRDYGEERMWRQIAARICNARPITTNAELVRAIGRGKAKKGKKEIHPATRTFQAIRIAVNDELSAIEEVGAASDWPACPLCLRPCPKEPHGVLRCPKISKF